MVRAPRQPRTGRHPAARLRWPREADWHELLKPDPGRWSEWVSFAGAADLPLLLGFTGADAADAAEALGDRDIVAEAMVAVRDMFGSAIPDPVGFQRTRWRSEQLALGSYSYHAVGSGPADRRKLARPCMDGRLMFAGEACTADYQGTVHGAYLSGIAAAQQMASIGPE